MTMTDPIADMLTRIRNALQAGHQRVVLPSSKVKMEIARILKTEGFIGDFRREDDGVQGKIHIDLKYDKSDEGIILGIERVSRPGRRVYKGKEDIPKTLGGLGVTVISTSRGVMTDTQARRHGVGGEVLFRVW